jgi:hypothetical protein
MKNYMRRYRASDLFFADVTNSKFEVTRAPWRFVLKCGALKKESRCWSWQERNEYLTEMRGEYNV